MKISSLVTSCLIGALTPLSSGSNHVFVAANTEQDETTAGRSFHSTQRNLGSWWDPDIATIATEDGRFDTLVVALNLTDLVPVFTCLTRDYWWCRSYTVFAPTDEAFADQAVQPVVEKYTTDPEFLLHLRSLLLYHVSWGETFASHIQDGGMVHTLLGEDLSTSVTSHGVFINSAQAIEADVSARNGVIHGIDSLLIPSFVTNDIVSVASNAGVFTSLIEAAVDTGVTADLSLEPLTVFAPTDDAFAAAADVIAELSVDEIAEVLRYHVIAGAIVTSSEVETSSVSTFQGETLDIAMNHGSIALNIDTHVTSTDILASNGIIHVIDQVLLPPSIAAKVIPTITDIVVESGNFSTLEAALASVDLVDTFNGTGSFTVFAPTDAAFAKLGDTVVDLLGTGTLANILQYHVLGDIVLSRDLERGPVEALNGGIIGVSFYHGQAYLNGNTRITTYDIRAANGVIHVIDTVLMPKTVVEVAEELGFTSLVGAIDSVDGIRDALSDIGTPVTVFAPTNAAFHRLGDISGLSSDDLGSVLTYHVVPGVVLYQDLEEGDVVTLNGGALTVDFYKPWWWTWWWSPRVYIESPTVSATLSVANVYAANGVIHVISEVLIP